ncbi:uncharacterized protein BYT42DRAFT_255423 [Radiomyces spectabilis]|uniref:uncharacterized protein n=1 Tax=Radiomyces spectabilis TaxID=64574 RepID=UPI00221F0FC1|nr:uncharacterized protein BYT42DRAFT_255423 [Radiomyces spectabilis]KAI8384275.1 hypothetical protein BYT42DRAFT_255423 [Radiomyces spectabilis]
MARFFLFVFFFYPFATMPSRVNVAFKVFAPAPHPKNANQSSSLLFNLRHPTAMHLFSRGWQSNQQWNSGGAFSFFFFLLTAQPKRKRLWTQSTASNPESKVSAIEMKNEKRKFLVARMIWAKSDLFFILD